MARWSAKLPTANVIASWSLDDLPGPRNVWSWRGPDIDQLTDRIAANAK
jgi:hypothetical protein